MGALSAGLALPFSFAIHAAAFEVSSAAVPSSEIARPSVRESVFDRWHNYALAAITPSFSWALLPASFKVPDVLDDYTGERPRSAAFSLHGRSSPLTVSLATHRVLDTPGILPDQNQHLIDLPQPGLQRTIVAPSLAADWGERGDIRVTGLLAYQRFASLGLGMTEIGSMPLPPWYRNSSHGAGARADIGNAIGNNVFWNVGYQSRIAMGALNGYRGVFADRGEFDVPANANINLGYAITQKLGVDIGVQRVMYSAIRPFTSSGLPTRFLALLGDSSSPVFEWRDLDVYSIGGRFRSDVVGTWELRYTTRQQPRPTSRLLESALSSAVANNAVSFGWTHTFGAASEFNLITSYASSQYYLLLPGDRNSSDAKAGQVEFEALWSTRF